MKAHRTPSIWRLLGALLALAAVSQPARAERLLLVAWDVSGDRSQRGAAKQVESVLWSLVDKVGVWVPARFAPVRDAGAGETVEKQLEEAWQFVVADSDGRRNPESLEQASGAYFAAKNALGQVRPGALARIALLLAVPTLRNGQDALARDYVRLALHADAAVAGKGAAFGADVERLVAEVASADELARPAELRIEVVPAEAVVELNGQPMGQPATLIRARPGLHLVQATASGHYPRGWLVDVGGGLEQQKLALESHPSRTRWQRAMAALEAAPAGPDGLRAPEGAGDLVALAEADALMALAVQGTDDEWTITGGVFRQGEWKPFRETIARNVEALQRFEALLRSSLSPVGRRGTDPEPPSGQRAP